MNGGMPHNPFAEDALDGLSDVRIFVTGGTGFFGKWLLSLLLENRKSRNVNVVVLSRDPESYTVQFPSLCSRAGVAFVRGDIRDFSFPSGRFDYVVHAATEASAKLDREKPDEMYSVIVDGTRRVLDFARQAGVRRVLYVSSGAVYGVQPPDLAQVPESFPCQPVTAYGKGKLQAERLCSESGLDAVVARCFAFVGPWLPLDSHFAIGNFIRDALFERPIVVQGDGRPLRSYLYAADLAVWLLTLLLSGKSGQAYNVGSPEAISVDQLARLVSKLARSHPDVVINGAPDERQPPPRYVPDTRLAERELSLRVETSLETAIQRTLLFYETHPVPAGVVRR